MKYIKHINNFEPTNERVYKEHLPKPVQAIINKIPKSNSLLPQFGKQVWNKVNMLMTNGVPCVFIVESMKAYDNNLGQYVVISDVNKLSRIIVEDLDKESTNIWIAHFKPNNTTFFSISLIEDFGTEFFDSERDQDGRLTSVFFDRFTSEIKNIIDTYSYDHVYSYLNYNNLSIVIIKVGEKYMVFDGQTGKPYFSTKLSSEITKQKPVNFAYTIYNHILSKGLNK
jgi:hypothetical protein